MNNSEALQNDFRRTLSSYINGGYVSKEDLVFALISPQIVFTRNAPLLIQKYHKFVESLSISGTSSLNLQIEIYRGPNPYVRQMMQYLASHLKEDLAGAYVHGSLGVYDEISYSDFDALVILKQEVFESAKRLANAAQKLHSALSIMFNYDPLQHHGWFVLVEPELISYPENYFPVELFWYAKALLPNQGLELKPRDQNLAGINRRSFDDLSNNVITRIMKKDYPKNMYQLKGLLSQFMLLPSYYVQVRVQKGVFKKHSFAAAKVDFSAEDWSVMDEVSLIRQNWEYKISALKRKLFANPRRLVRLLARKYGPPIPASLQSLLTDDFYHRMKKLVVAMQARLA
jgi:hypothetical protein